MSNRLISTSLDRRLHGDGPTLLRDQESTYSKLLSILAEIRATGSSWQSAAQVTRLYNERYREHKHIDAITKILRRFYTWQLVAYKERPDNQRGGLWSLKAEVNPNDTDDLFYRAETQTLLRSSSVKRPHFCVVAKPKSIFNK